MSQLQQCAQRTAVS